MFLHKISVKSIDMTMYLSDSILYSWNFAYATGVMIL